MSRVNEYSDALELTEFGSEISGLRSFGDIPGVVFARIAAANGVGVGWLRGTGVRGRDLSWRAPGSNSYGRVHNVDLSSEAVLEDGNDQSKWVLLRVFNTYIFAAHETRVLLRDDYGGILSIDDVSAAEASAGTVDTLSLKLRNARASTRLRDIRVWVDPASRFLELSDDNVVFVSPISEETALTFPDLQLSSSHSIWVRRTIPAGTLSAPTVLNLIKTSFRRF